MLTFGERANFVCTSGFRSRGSCFAIQREYSSGGVVSLAIAKRRGEFAAVAATPLSFEVRGGSGALLDPPHELEVERL